MSEDIDDALKRAEELAEITGRDKKDIIADLLDDGQLNMSAGEDIDNKDFLDIAQEKVDKLKALLMTLLPVFALIVGGTGFEMFGVTDWSPVGDDYPEEEYYDVYGCTDPNAINYMYDATVDDGYCSYDEEVYGCTNDAAPNYDELATIDDGSCEPTEEVIEGCTDSEADNYNSEAEEDDGSCEYPPPPECEPVYYDIYVFYQSNNTKVVADFDIDCSNEEATENVEIQFLAWTNGTNPSNSEGPYNWTSEHYDIAGEEWDSHRLILGNFTHGYYDLYVYLIGEDGEIDIEKNWLNIEINGET